jgi:hypothetical protein
MCARCGTYVELSNSIKLINVTKTNHLGLIECDYIATFDDMAIFKFKIIFLILIFKKSNVK